MNRVTFLVDGFNLYHSVKEAQRDMNGVSTKWLNIRALCQSYIHHFGKDAQLGEIYLLLSVSGAFRS